MSKKSCQGNHPRLPAEYKGIQVNCCKFTRCDNFGLTPDKTQETELFKEYNKNKVNRQVRDKDPFYKISGKKDKISSIKCLSCEEINQNSIASNQVLYVLKSNKSVH